ncbi:type I polyketide synthase [Saccharothrix algeriensis]|uniref:Acyl transferase domain-containing protein/acyl carrier protein n=2 Tax=Saccharothrix algeriensis TaxID=173560 RepID=A0ABS2SE16_9PSEU|nr:type I polyketide synthase [Saccharothrix algeriensis]MBM7814503.1 acyl transferase domain-containing protein/acyl carrier protein [Saccharothrix algeriensis]
MTEQTPGEGPAPSGIAVIGLAGRFPGAVDLDRYWANLRDGVESIEPIGDDELRAAGVGADRLADPDYVRMAPKFAGIAEFDAEFFGCSPREAAAMDPQHRIFLELAWAALEDAGYGEPGRVDGSVGVFGGASTTAYLDNITANLDRGAAIRGENVGLGFELAFLASRVSYKLDLRGPSLPVQTACSTALVAVHAAGQSLLNYECDLAVCGAVAYKVPDGVGYRYQEGSFLSPDGHVRPFDAAARGTVFGNGAGVVVLKRLEDALADGDTVHAVILGSAVNNDGAGKASFTAPAVSGQAAVVAEAMAAAEVDPEDIDYVEAHGTGTIVGDAIEVEALNRAFGGRGRCALGSVKGNVGHLDAAAGMAGLIKTVLALKHETLPATLNHDTPNPEIDFAAGGFRVQAERAPWPRVPGRPRRAGVSAFGFGGTNAHVILEEAPAGGPRSTSDSSAPVVLTVSARTAEELDAATDRLADHWDRHSPDPADAAHTLALGRRAFPHRRAVVVTEPATAADSLRTRDPATSVTGASATPDVVFLFTGQGSQHVGMGEELYRTEPVYRDTVDHCADLLKPLLQHDIRDVMYKPNQHLHTTLYAQPALFTTEYALTRLWQHWGITPTTMIGHSLGEWVAATTADIFTLHDALTLITHRATLMHHQPPGAMLNIITTRHTLHLPPHTTLAAHNSPRDCVISGTTDDIHHFAQQAQANGVITQPLATPHAYHHPSMAPAADQLHALLRTTTLRPPSTPITSTTTATTLTPAQATDPRYWSNQLTATVEYNDAVANTTTPTTTYLEIGPGNTLTTLAKRVLADTGSATPTIASLPHRRDRRGAVETTRHALARLWAAGAQPRWEALSDGERRRVPLPGYPFRRTRHWLDIPDGEPTAPAPGRGPHPLLDAVALRSAGQSVFRTDFDTGRHWVLAEHRLLGEAIVPGTTYLEMARAAAAHHLGRPVTELRDVAFLVPLLVRDGVPRTVHTTVRDGEDGTAVFTVDSHDPATDRWTRHAQGVAGTAAAPAPDRVDPAALRARCAEQTLDMSARQSDHRVMAFGERWVRSLRTVHVGNRCALGELTLPERHRAECDAFGLHPALLDLATGFTGFAVAGSADEREAADAERGFFLPVGYDRLVLHGPLPARALSLITAHPGTRLDGEVRSVDVHVYDESGAPAATITGFTTKRVADPDRAVAGLRPRAHHHALRWTRATGGPGPADTPARVLVVAEPGGTGPALAEEFRAAGSAVDLAVLGDAPARDGDRGCTVAPTVAGFGDLLDALGGRPDLVVHVAAPHAGAGVAARLDTGVLSLFHLARALAERGVAPRRLGVVAPVVSAVTGREGVPAAVHASLFGLAAVIGAESQGTEVRCVDVEEGTDPAAVRAELVGERAPVTVALRDRERYVRELAAVDLREHPRPEPIPADRVHLITGGLGGLGLACAGHLAATGVRLALFGRAVPRPGDTDPRSAARAAAVRELTGMGAEVRTYAVDVTDADAVAGAVRRVRAELGPIGCVLHAAGVAGDGFLFRKDTATFRRTLDPKVLGAVAIAEATADDRPTTVFFGSTAAVFGPAGQGDYAAANAFLDAYAEELTARGRDAVSIAWTDWLGTGMAADHGVRPDQGFFRSVSTADGLAALDEVLAARRPGVIVGEVNRARLGDPAVAEVLRRSPVVLSEPLSRAVADARGGGDARGTDGTDGTNGTDGPVLFGRTDGGYRPTERALARIWAAELGLAELNVRDSSFALGVDSLAALRIAQNIHKTLSLRVSMADMFRYATVAELAEHLDGSTTAADGPAGEDTA